MILCAGDRGGAEERRQHLAKTSQKVKVTSMLLRPLPSIPHSAPTSFHEPTRLFCNYKHNGVCLAL